VEVGGGWDVRGDEWSGVRGEWGVRECEVGVA
jgi:hypothetical protein